MRMTVCLQTPSEPDRRSPAQEVSGRYAFRIPMGASETKPKAFGWHGLSTVPEPEERPTTTHVTIATRTPGPLLDLTEKRWGLVVDAYPLGRLLLLRCTGDMDEIERAPELRGSGRDLLYHARSGDEVTLLLAGGKDDEDVISLLADEKAHLVPPIRWQRGEAFVTLVLEDGSDPRSLVGRFPNARLVSKRRTTNRYGSGTNL